MENKMSCLYKYNGDRTCEICKIVNNECYDECRWFSKFKRRELDMENICPNAYMKERWVDCEDWRGVRDSEFRKEYHCKLNDGSYFPECSPNQSCFKYLDRS